MNNRFELIGKPLPKQEEKPDPPKIEEEVVLRLTRDEADTLLIVLGNVGGPTSGRRGQAERIFQDCGGHLRHGLLGGRGMLDGVEGRVYFDVQEEPPEPPF